jgi:thiol:disulfide interchange protein
MSDLFTPESLVTLSGSVAAVWLVVNVIRHVTGWGPRWFGLLVALGMSLAGFFAAGGAGEATERAWLHYLAVLINGLLIYSSAFGIQQTVLADRAGRTPAKRGGSVRPMAAERIGFASGW